MKRSEIKEALWDVIRLKGNWSQIMDRIIDWFEAKGFDIEED